MVSRATQVLGLRDKARSQDAQSHPGSLSVAMLFSLVKTFRKREKEMSLLTAFKFEQFFFSAMSDSFQFRKNKIDFFC